MTKTPSMSSKKAPGGSPGKRDVGVIGESPRISEAQLRENVWAAPARGGDTSETAVAQARAQVGRGACGRHGVLVGAVDLWGFVGVAVRGHLAVQPDIGWSIAILTRVVICHRQ